MTPQDTARQNLVRALGELALQSIEQQSQIAALMARIKSLEGEKETDATAAREREEAQHVDDRRTPAAFRDPVTPPMKKANGIARGKS